jgi:hypothetical protein
MEPTRHVKRLVRLLPRASREQLVAMAVGTITPESPETSRELVEEMVDLELALRQGKRAA